VETLWSGAFTARSVAGGPVPQAVVTDEPHHHGSDGQDADQRKPRRVEGDGRLARTIPTSIRRRPENPAIARCWSVSGAWEGMCRPRVLRLTRVLQRNG
jgi:hypothetical protein